MITKHSKNVHSVDCGRKQEFLLVSDLHWDNPKCDRALLQNHLEEAKKRNAKVIVNGDFFDLMGGRGDPRRSKEDIRPEHNNGRYLDSIVDTAVEWFRPYADIILLVGYGNHETSIIQHQETDILQRFVTILNHSCKTDIQLGGYGGVLDFKMHYDNIRACNFVTHYYHGHGGGGPVTRGVISDQRILASIEGYDCTWQGHVHELYYHQNIVNRYVRAVHQIVQKPVHQVRTATYKEEWADGYMGFHVEKGRGPKPLGGYWMNLEVNRSKSKDMRGPELQVFATFSTCDRFY